MADSTIPLDVTGSPDLYLASSTYTHDGETAHAEHTVVVEVDGTPVSFATQTTLAQVLAAVQGLPTTNDVDVLSLPAQRRLDDTNSTFTPLTDGGTFVGEWASTDGLAALSVLILTDQPLTVAQLEYSDDGVSQVSNLLATEDYIESVDTSTAGFYFYYPDPHSYLLHPYYRLRLENDSGTDCTITQGWSWTFPTGAEPWTFLSLNSEIGTFSKALLTRSVVAGENPDGDLVNQVITGTKTITPTPAALGAAGEYTSDSIDTELHPTLLLLFGADQPSATDGIELCWSDTEDFTVLRSVERYTFRTGNITDGLFFQTRTRARWLRIKYTNNATTAQGRFFINLRMNPVPLVKDVTLASTAQGQTGQQDVGTSPSKVASSPLVGRRSMRLKNLSSSARPLFYGFTNGLNIANGDELGEGEAIELDVDEFVDVYVVCASTGGGGVRCSWTEIGGG